uniref:Uncharacterized protein LOC111107782 n=1 Tax=Crassostrea virginica TaxID=6565 RepID=A0A8B8B6T9_CRAVI|nr:uncharacterized protein LOC111107782 [Crassostrea virginica]
MEKYAKYKQPSPSSGFAHAINIYGSPACFSAAAGDSVNTSVDKMGKDIKDQFKLDQLKISNAEPRTFVLGKLVPTFFYPIWSAIWAVFHLLNFILMPYYRIDLAPYKEAWPFYLSNWTYTVLTVGAVSDCIATFYVFCKKQSLLVPIPGGLVQTPWYLQVVWVTYNITNVSALMMLFLLGSLVTDDKGDVHTDSASILVQIFSGIYVIGNIFVGSKETRILHVYQPLIFLFVYTLFFNMIPSLAIGRAIYPNMDWNNEPGFGVLWLFGIMLLIAPLVHLLVYGLYLLREFIEDKCCKKGATDLP